MKNILKKFHKSETGQSMVELALVTPILILILCMIIDFGWIFSNRMIITHASREASRYGSVTATQLNSQQLIEQRVLKSIPEYVKNDIVVNVIFTNIYDLRAGDVEVKISYTIRALTPIAGIFFGSQDIEISSTSIMKVE